MPESEPAAPHARGGGMEVEQRDSALGLVPRVPADMLPSYQDKRVSVVGKVVNRQPGHLTQRSIRHRPTATPLRAEATRAGVRARACNPRAAMPARPAARLPATAPTALLKQLLPPPHTVGTAPSATTGASAALPRPPPGETGGLPSPQPQAARVRDHDSATSYAPYPDQALCTRRDR
jgi:hypothetical protein